MCLTVISILCSMVYRAGCAGMVYQWSSTKSASVRLDHKETSSLNDLCPRHRTITHILRNVNVDLAVRECTYVC